MTDRKLVVEVCLSNEFQNLMEMIQCTWYIVSACLTTCTLLKHRLRQVILNISLIQLQDKHTTQPGNLINNLNIDWLVKLINSVIEIVFGIVQANDGQAKTMSFFMF